ncbi:uncharacterized protein HMPREF1541_01477 [Cyphellophora europaea CBS 101466]|uniref:Glutathione S-transferase n=1 Tax=Cyphellophora europaea (strain CBS 101466) TaxID=1220924 RepID=W2S2P8_CYPE1|nr:uncharacterized protein HMPREF1541_01477 [Cyphellophora europaea CBS 101466]ETN42323.1 hypothetical protein HMPREF1541_01477 [Cyphellophora europaea CBS 101466]
MQPITVWGHWGAPNPWKVIIILKELKLPYTHRLIELSDVKKEPLISVNPNGRLPAIEDPNTGVKLWESGAIILYLVEQYDTEGKISNYTQADRMETQQWLLFQASGQGPCLGQLAWFARFHAEKLPSAIDRYAQEAERLVKVLDSCLEKSKWLVGDKCTYADLSFVTWAHVADGLFKQLGTAEVLDRSPNYVKWLDEMKSRPSVRECLEAITAGRAEHGLPP